MPVALSSLCVHLSPFHLLLISRLSENIFAKGLSALTVQDFYGGRWEAKTNGGVSCYKLIVGAVSVSGSLCLGTACRGRRITRSFAA